jgi:hypothetical protein
LEELTGYLIFCSQVIPYSRTFITSLFNFSASFSSQFSCHHISHAAHRDITWWLTYCTHWNGIHCISLKHPVIKIYTDASSTKGAGGIFGSCWFSISIPQHYNHRDIKFKEFYAIVYAVHCWGHDFSGNHIQFYTDNTNVNDTICGLSIHSQPTMELLHQLIGLATHFDFTFGSHWIPMNANSLADAASCFPFLQLFQLAPYLNHKPCFKQIDINAHPTALLSHPATGLV